MKNINIKRKEYTLPEQAMNLRLSHPESIIELCMNELRWTKEVQAHPFSEIYTIEVIYQKNGVPETWVSGNNIKKLEDKDFPHKYEVDTIRKRVRLCLYYPKAEEWSAEFLISRTIIFWATEWLFYYEIWLVTGKWYGGGIHPEIK